MLQLRLRVELRLQLRVGVMPDRIALGLLLLFDCEP